jgi:hypothetical protein
MEKTINIEFTTTMDRSVYEDSPWKTKEGFFKQMVVSHIDKDAKLYANVSAKMESPEKETYSGLVQTLKEIKANINNSIQYELLSVKDNMEEVKISFNFQYYENPIFSKDQLVEKIIFNQSIKDSKFFAERLPKMDHGATKEKLDSAVKMYNHVADFMEKAKSSLVVTESDLVSKPQKMKM